MAKRKRKPGDRPGFKFTLAKDYQSEQYVMYVMKAETGLLQAGAINKDLTDGEVIEALEDLISQLQDPELFAQLLLDPKPDESQESNTGSGDGDYAFAQHFVLMNLRLAFEQHGPLEAEDVIGILDVIKTSVKRHSVGPHRRGYLTFIEGFLGQIGVKVWQLSDEEVETMGLRQLEDPRYLDKGD